jgi:hypothetical protein
MERRRISARDAVADIRSGMSDTALMKKYEVSKDGLQSLFNKLVNNGFIDLGEMRSRLSDCWGTVVVPETDIFGANGGAKDQPLKSKPIRTINALEAARDIRLGLDDFALTEKYHLTPKGLTGLCNKLLSMGLLAQADLDRRPAPLADQTVDLREFQRELGDALKHLGFGSTAPSTAEAVPRSQQSAVSLVVGTEKEEIAGTGEKTAGTFQRESRDPGPSAGTWYDQPIVLGLVLLGLFPLGFYGLYQTRTIAPATKGFIILAWFALAVVWGLVFCGTI